MTSPTPGAPTGPNGPDGSTGPDPAQPGYPQQAPGYPQQPGYYQQPPGYPQQPGYPPQQPPGYPQQPGYYQQPGYPQQAWQAGPRPLSPSDEQTWAVLAHLAGLLVPFGWLIIYLVLRDRSAFVRHHAAEASNFHLSVLIYSVVLSAVGIPLALLTLGIGFLVLIPVYVVLGIGALVLAVLGAMAASRRQEYRYPLTIRMIK
jgi:hypothetical protein